jgi:hypothetical protein
MLAALLHRLSRSVAHEFATTSASLSASSQLTLVEAFRRSAAAGDVPPRFNDVGFRVSSQHEEDGLILYLFAILGTTDRRCVEVCAGDGSECNSANLILQHNWTGLLFDGNENNVARGRALFASHPSTREWPPIFQARWITRANINDLVAEAGFAGDVDLLTIHVDGNDYWFWEALTVIRPRVVVIEFNHLWGPHESVSIPYADDFKAEFSEYGADYAGASLAAFVNLGSEKGYRLVGANRYGTNAFFVRMDLVHPWLPTLSPDACFGHPRARFGMKVRLDRVRSKPWIRV